MSSIFASNTSLQPTHKQLVTFHRTENLERCRICLEQTRPLLSLPCNCKGELGQVHEKCFSKWVQINSPLCLASSIIESKCQICCKSIKVQVKTDIKLKTCSQLQQSHRYCQIVSAMVAAGVIIFLIYLCVRGIIGNVGGSFIMFIVYGVVIIFLLVVLKVVIQITLRIFKKTQIVSLNFVTKLTPGEK